MATCLVGFSISGGLGCATSRYVGPVITPADARTISREAGDDDVVALLAPPASQEPPVPAKLVWVSPGTARVVTPAGASISVPSSDVRVAATRDRGRGAVEGLGIGALTGAALGAGLGFAAASGCSPNSWGCIGPSGSGAALIGAVAFGALGGLVGTIVGVITGHQNRYVFGPDAR